MPNTFRGEVTAASSIEAADVPERRQSTFVQSSGSMELLGAPSSAAPGSNAGLMGLSGNALNMLRRPIVPARGMSENGQDSSLEDDAEDDVQEEFVRPGAPKEKARKRPDVAPRADGLFESFAQAAPQLMAEGKLEAKDFMMLGLFEKMMRRDAKSESKRDLDEEEGDSDGEDLDRSRRVLWQVNDFSQIALDIKVHPTRIIKEFERTSALSLGVKPGMP